MRARHRLWPDGLAARLALLLAAALIAANLVALALLSADRDRQDRAARIEREVERIASLVPALEAAAPDSRRDIAREATTRSSRLSVEGRPQIGTTGPDARSVAVAAYLKDALGGRDVRVAIADGRRGTPSVAMSIPLTVPPDAAAQWLHVVSRGAGGPPRGADEKAFLTGLAISLVAVLCVALLAVRRLTRPLADLAQAARAAGRGDRTARVNEAGPREMRAAAVAFNDMQDRIERFDAERMRTLAAVGHDLRTPITSLRIRAEMLDKTDAIPMIRTLEEMTVMADGLVAYARGLSDAEPVQDIDLGELLAHLCVARSVPLDVDAPVTVRGGPVALGRAIGNLIDNALHYGDTAMVRLSPEGAFAIVTIEDDGPGIPPDRFEAVFEPFVRGEDSRSSETGGTGLGLSIARGIVADHGGEVRLDNRTQGGLRATVRLPKARNA